MPVATKQLGAALLATLVLGGGALPRASAQYVNPSPVAGGYPYAFPYFQTPANGYLTGGASVISSQGQFMVNKQQSALMNQQVEQSKIDTKRKTFDNWLYEREKTPTLEDERERQQQQELRRAVNQPPITEILSAKSLNDLLFDLQKMAAQGVQGPRIALEQDALKHINVTTGTNEGNIGLLRSGTNLSWPLGISGLSDSKKVRGEIESLLTQARSQAMQGQVDPGVLLALKKDIDNLGRIVKSHVADMEPMDYIGAKRYLTELSHAVEVLQQPNARNYLDGKYAAKGGTVDELVQYMTQSGLRFAPATQADSAAYVSVYNGMAAYDQAVHGSSFKVAQQAPPPAMK